MRYLILCVLIFGASLARAVEGGATWLNVDYTYTDYTNKESGMSEIGRLAGIRGEIGVVVASQLAVSAGGEYQDGNLDFDGSTLAGTSVKQVTKDYFIDTRLLVHYFMGTWVFSSGIVQRERFENLVGSYRRRDKYAYLPVIATYHVEKLYFRVETGFNFKGKTDVMMSDLGGGARDLDFSRGTGTGLAVEVGYTAPTGGGFATRLFLNYRRMNLADAGTQNDGVRNVTLSQMNVDTIQAGIGIGY